MSEMNFKTILQIFEDAGYSPTRYSGRGMFGDYCVGIQVMENVFDALLEIISLPIENGFFFEGTEDQEALEFIERLKGAKTDELGKNAILYFPNLKWEDPEEENEE